MSFTKNTYQDLGIVLLLGSEAKGPAKETLDCFESKTIVGIPLSHSVDSLNVAVAGGILMNRLNNL